MSAINLNVEIYDALRVIAQDESLLRKAARSLKRLAAQKKDDDALYSKSEYMAIINQSLEEVKSGQFGVLTSEQEIDTFLDSL